MKKIIQMLLTVLLLSLMLYMPFLIHFEVATISQIIKAVLLLLAFNTAINVL